MSTGIIYRTALISAVLFCIRLSFSVRGTDEDGSAERSKGKTCQWAPTCRCNHVTHVERGFSCVYNSMYIDGHDIVTCSDQSTFPRFLDTNEWNDFTDILGNFSRVPPNALAYKQFSKGQACVYITTKAPRLVIDQGAFRGVEGIYVVENVDRVIVMPNAATAAVEREGPSAYGRYGVEKTGLHFYNVKNVDLPKGFAKSVIPAKVSPPTSTVTFRISVKNSQLTNLDRNVFGFDEVQIDEISLPWLEGKYFRELIDLFDNKSKVPKHVADLILVAHSAKNRLKFRIDLENAILSNGNLPVDLGLPIEKINSISFLDKSDGKSQQYNDQLFEKLSVFKNGLKTFGCKKCNMKRTPAGISVMTKLEKLDLSENKIVSISSQTFSKTTNLIALDLSSNEIRSIDPTSFDNLINLQSLDMSYNPLGRKLFRLISAKVGKLPKLKEFLCDECEKTELSNNE